MTLEITREHHKDLQKYILTDIKEVCRPTCQDKDPTARSTENVDKDFNRVGAYRSVIDLEWSDTQLVGKVLHLTFFSSAAEPGGIQNVLTKFVEEIKLLSKMKHPNIVLFLGIYYRQDSVLPVLVVEKMEFSLTQLLATHKKGFLSDDSILGILLDVSKGLVYLHEVMNVAHRDLSSNSILLTANLSAKIAYLGSARVLNRPGGWASKTNLFSQPSIWDFMPPEALEDPPTYTVSVDVFSFGCVIIHICTHKWPTPMAVSIQGKSISEFDRRWRYISEINCPIFLLPLIKQCLEELNTRRPTSNEIVSLLQSKKEENARELPLCYTYAPQQIE